MGRSFPGLAPGLQTRERDAAATPETRTTRPSGGRPVSTGTSDITEIRRQMAQIRRELHEDVRDVVATAEAVTDWRRYLRNYPWVALGAAFAAGFWVVPKRQKPLATLADLSRAHEAANSTRRGFVESVREAPRSEAVQEVKRKRGVLGAVLGMVTPLALKYAQGYALKFAESWLQQQLHTQFQAGPTPPPAPHPGRPAGPQGFGPGPNPRPGPGAGPGFGPYPPGR